MQRNPHHDYDDPASEANLFKAYNAMNDYEANPRTCTFCQEVRRLLALPGTAWGWETFHNPICPENEDNQEPVAVRVTEHFNGAEYMEAEAIWAASEGDPS